MAYESPKSAKRAGSANKKADAGNATGAGGQFTLPAGYANAYLSGGGSDKGAGAGEAQASDGELEQLHQSGEIEQRIDEEGPTLEKRYGAWLRERIGIEQVGRAGAKLPPPERKKLLEVVAPLKPIARRALAKAIEEHGDVERLGAVLGMETAAQLAQPTTPIVVEPKKPAGDDEQADGAEAASGEGAAQAAQDQDKDQEGGASGGDEQQAEGGKEPAVEAAVSSGEELFERVLKAPLERKKPLDGGPILAQIEALPEGELDALARIVEQRGAWEPLAALLGPGLQPLVGKKRYEPLARALADHPDGVLEPEERSRLVGMLGKLGPFEAQAVRRAIEEKGSAAALGTLLGKELVLWLGGEAAALEAQKPVEEPEAALTATRQLKPATVRRLLERLDQAASGPLLEEALADELNRFVEGYWAAVTNPDPRRKRTPKEALQALARIDVGQLRALAHSNEKPGEEPTEIRLDATTAQLEALLKPIVQGATLTEQSREATLKALEELSLVELDKLIALLPPDGMPRIESALGPRLLADAEKRVYEPLEQALAAHPLDEELPQAQKSRYLERLETIAPWMRTRLQAAVTARSSGARLHALFGDRLKKVGLDEVVAGAGAAQAPLPLTLSPQQRKAALEALKRLGPVQLEALLRDLKGELKPDALFRLGTRASAGPDPDLGRALLKLVPTGEPHAPDGSDPAGEPAALKAFFERLVAEEKKSGIGADAPRRQPAAAAPERKRKKEDGEEEAPTHEGLDMPSLYHQLMSQHLRLDGQEHESTPEQRQETVQTFRTLPDVVRRALVDHMVAEGTYADAVRVLGSPL